MNIVAYGGGTNSTAILIGLHERGECPDHILFSDTGSEKPHTYTHIIEVNKWCNLVGFPEITIIKPDQPQQLKDGSLENECVRLGCLPSKAYGFGGCSMKWKLEPQNKYIRRLMKAEDLKADEIIRMVGFDADEYHRAERAMEAEERNGAKTGKQRFPLIEWDWGRDECIDAIRRAGLPQPGKSACFFCPSSKKDEIIWLRDNHPNLLERALEMERKALAGEGTATATRSAGLGRNFSWAEFLKYGATQTDMFSDAGTPEIDCMCYDG